MSETIQLPLLATVKTAFHDVFGDIKSLAQSVWLILLMMVLLVEIPTLVFTDYIFDYVHDDKKVEATTPSPPVGNVPTEKTDPSMKDVQMSMEQAKRIQPEHLMILMSLNLLQMAFIISFSVAWYRRLLFGENGAKTITFGFGKNEWDFAKTFMKASLVLFPVLMVLMSYGLASMPEFAEGKPEEFSNTWPIFLIFGVALLYLLGSLSMSYPLTIMGQTAAPIKDSWNLTKPHVGRLMLGNIMLFVPSTIVAILLISCVSWLITLPMQNAPGEVVASAGRDPFFISLCLKTLGGLFLLVLLALLASFHARVYAFLVRSQQAEVKD